MPASEDNNMKKPVVIAGAICAPPPNNSATAATVPQPKQPNSLAGLLNFAMEVKTSATAADEVLSSSSDEPKMLPLDSERRKFLENALHALTIDVIETLLKQIAILRPVDKLQESDNPDEYAEALNTISDYVCDIDTANDFHKIGGFTILQPCMRCKQPVVRLMSCNLLAELCQNNPYCQGIALDNGFVPDLLSMIENDVEVDVVSKAVYATSCLIRQNTAGFDQFIQYRGVQIFRKTLVHRKDDRCIMKTCFLLNALCRSQPDFSSRLVFDNFVPVLVGLVTDKHTPSHLHVLGLLLSLIENNSTALAECKQHAGFQEILAGYASNIRNRDAYMEEVEYCERITDILYSKN